MAEKEWDWLAMISRGQRSSMGGQCLCDKPDTVGRSPLGRLFVEPPRLRVLHQGVVNDRGRRHAEEQG